MAKSRKQKGLGAAKNKFRDRVSELRRVRAGDLVANPKNWRQHPDGQRKALDGILDEVGFAGVLMARLGDDGEMILIDGHLRAEQDPDQELPVIILDVSEAEADKLLAVYDPIGAMAKADREKLGELLQSFNDDIANEDLSEMVSKLAADHGILNLANEELIAEVDIEESFQVVIECDDEHQQKAIFERMTKEGHKCRVMTL